MNRSRTKNSISQVLKSFGSLRSILHLFGNSWEHQIDALLSERWQAKESRRRLLRKIPRYLHDQVEKLVALAASHREDLEFILTEGLTAAGFVNPAEASAERFSIREVTAGRLGSGAGNLIQNLIFSGTPGQRLWRAVDESEWVSFLTQELEYRANYVTADRHHKQQRELWNIYFRLPPWVARVANRDLDDPSGAAILGEIAIMVAKKFGAEFEVDTIGVAVHSENEMDLHLHIIFSPSREVEVTKTLPEYKARNIVRQIAERMRREAVEKGVQPPGRNKLLKAAREEMEQRGLASTKFVELRRGRYPRPMRVLGPSFRYKRKIWAASGYDPQIAVAGDRPAWESNSFRSVVVESVSRCEDLREKFADVWGEELFEELVREVLGPSRAATIAEYSKRCVESYREFGSAVPGFEEFIGATAREMQESLPELISEDLAKREQAVSEREKAVELKTREHTIAIGLLTRIREELGLEENEDLLPMLRRLLREKKRAEERLKAAVAYLRNILKDRARNIGDVVRNILNRLLVILDPSTKEIKRGSTRTPEDRQKPEM